MNLTEEFEKQVKNLIQKGYPKTIGISEEEFFILLEPLGRKIQSQSLSQVDLEKGYLPFVIVIKNDLVPTEKSMSLVERNGRSGITKLYPLEPNDFQTIPDISIPISKVYLLIDIDRGKENINLPPNEAMKFIREANRLPLTIDEGVAIVTQFPEFLMKNNCFSLLASRHVGDQRVPAMWINAHKNPKLGWCWDGNPHTWLGSASCKSRI